MISNYTRTPDLSEIETLGEDSEVNFSFDIDSYPDPSVVSYQIFIVGFPVEDTLGVCYDTGVDPSFPINVNENILLGLGDYSQVDVGYFTSAGCMDTFDFDSLEAGSPAFSIIEGTPPEPPATSTVMYTFDVGTSVMLGACLCFGIAYWIVGLSRNRNKN